MRSHLYLTRALSIALAAGFATTAVAGPEADKPGARDYAKQTEQARQHARNAHTAPAFRSATDLIGTDVQNTQGETIATVEDFIFERGSGQIEQVVLRSGAVLGFGGKALAVPYDRLSFDAVEDVFSTGMTKANIENTSKFVPENWGELDREAWTSGDDWLGDLFEDGDDNAQQDSWASAVRDAETREIEGEILAARRNDWIDGQEYMTLVVQGKNGTDYVVAGPSWYVLGLDNAPERGEKIKAKVAVVPSESGSRNVLLETTRNGRITKFRTAEGAGRWISASSSNHANPPRRLVLMSSLIGADAGAVAGKDVGEIQDVIVETNSGRIAFVGFDPNENFLGLGDTILAMPWDAVNLTGSDKARVYASDDVMKRCPTLPDNAADLSSPQMRRDIYRVFDLEPANFERTRTPARKPTPKQGG